MASIIYVYAILAWLIYVVVSTVRKGFRQGLRSLPGPLFARFSGLYRVYMVFGGKGPQEYVKIHEKYGAIVRTGPNQVSVADPSAIPQIYGIGSKFLKVC